ncbi:unnamed protein product [Gongylonema pulchrum]|uniref:PITH domain-containing protein n=1 Tax=Gongylonema pulchrum TaxID=637853 RepID=A0A183CZC2_9BILA|nr:unnamed protein product [Gongylonema pulchrum]
MGSHQHCASEVTDFERQGEGMRYCMGLHIDLDKVRELREVTVLNEAVDGSGVKVFKKWENRMDRTEYVESDVDEELLFNIPFKGHVKITGLVLAGDLDGTHPSSLRIYKDRPSMSFEDAGGEADQEFSIKQDPRAEIDYALKASKFSNITYLSLFFPTNFGDEKTRIYYIGLRGEYLTNMRQQVHQNTFQT